MVQCLDDSRFSVSQIMANVSQSVKFENDSEHEDLSPLTMSVDLTHPLVSY